MGLHLLAFKDKINMVSALNPQKLNRTLSQFRKLETSVGPSYECVNNGALCARLKVTNDAPCSGKGLVSLEFPTVCIY